jgi:hypothetical protein
MCQFFLIYQLCKCGNWQYKYYFFIDCKLAQIQGKRKTKKLDKDFYQALLQVCNNDKASSKYLCDNSEWVCAQCEANACVIA